MRSLSLLVLLVLFCYGTEALKKRQLQETHAGYCPIPLMICNVYCPPDSADRLCASNPNCCTRDNQCASDEKCCRPACGCGNRCIKAHEKPGWHTKP